ncbi:hypothetical protein [Pseudanabaena yagii]|uniref:Metallophosphoesterase family protein n=1 Tax=Pseudanabaena yagii GIHE-NHR1 TaxID=2722753 RepID=A0ABX1LVD1_9CYAN|nr:hypothetical protein [Pseudanabaena yagii]NMF58754.1 metallophosphoesterase family protein [Pseudanabaena yagii GIHE-NHR1]
MNMCFEEIGLIGDVHAEADYLEIALHFFQMAQVEKILCVGDIVDLYLAPSYSLRSHL